MRNRLLNESLERLAAEAATHFTTLVAGGDQIPFDVAEQDGPDDSLFHSYVPLTYRYVEQRERELCGLAAYRPACEAVEASDVASAYLEQRGEPVPADPRERSARMLTVFLAALWDGCTEFSLDRARLDSALALLDAEVRDINETDLLVAPIIGFQMPVARLNMPRGLQVVRADTFEAPVEAMRSEGMGRTAWQPQFLAIAEQRQGEDSAVEALARLDWLTGVMRLFKRGSVGLGPHAFAPTGEGHWRRIATGAGCSRAGGYRLREPEIAELAWLAAELDTRLEPDGSIAWAIRRFELGCTREDALDGLSDQLLALRAVLEGNGPVEASLAKRAAALVEGDSRLQQVASERFEEALELERSLMRGVPSEGSSALATWVEDSVRGLLRQAALGELGSDLGTAADETLIAAGLGAGDVEIAVAAADAPEPVPARDAAEPVSANDFESPAKEEDMEQETRIMEPIPVEDEIRITAKNWLEEVEVADEAGTIEWPAGGSGTGSRERIDSPRVRHLFPVPEDADWGVRELDYDHYRRSAG